MNHLSVSRIVPPPAGFLSLQFGCLWCAFYVALVLLALAEAAFLRQMGLEHPPDSSLRQASVRGFSGSADGRWAAVQFGFARWSDSTGTSEEVFLHDLRQHTMRPLHVSHLEPRCVTMAAAADRIAIACQDDSIYLWSGPVSGSTGTSGSPAGKLRLLHRAHDMEITGLVLSPDGQLLAVAGRSSLQLLRLPEGGRLYRLAHDGYSTRFVFSDDSRRLVVFGLNGEVRWYDAHSGQQVGGKVLTEDKVVRSALSVDGRLGAYTFVDGRLSVWSLEAHQELWCIDSADSLACAKDTIGFSPDGLALAVACWADQMFWIQCYDAHTGARVGKSPRHQSIFKGLVVVADHVIYFWDNEGVIRAWKANQDQELWRFSWPLETNKSTSLVSTAGR